jgi:hypothetical protein
MAGNLAYHYSTRLLGVEYFRVTKMGLTTGCATMGMSQVTPFKIPSYISKKGLRVFA